MFTGIVEEVGTVKSVGSGKLTVAASAVLEGTRMGDSIAVNGACLTVSAMDAASFSVDVMPETLKRTNLGQLRTGSVVNLERALRVGGRVGGHLVQGHVDGTGKVVSLIPEGGAVIARFAAPPEVLRYVVEKGFIAVDGVSLTVVNSKDTSFEVAIIPFTHEVTNFHQIEKGTVVNIEFDILGKYIAKIVRQQLGRG